MNRRRSGGKRAQSWWALLQSKATKGVQANFTCLFLILVVSVFQYISFSVLVLYSSGCIENDRRAWRDMYSVVQLQIAGLHGEISGGGTAARCIRVAMVVLGTSRDPSGRRGAAHRTTQRGRGSKAAKAAALWRQESVASRR